MIFYFIINILAEMEYTCQRFFGDLDYNLKSETDYRKSAMNISWLLLAALFCMACLPGILQADAFHIKSESIMAGDTVAIRGVWRYNPHDSSIFADPSYDHSGWLENQKISTADLPGWDGVGWFRLELSVDSVLIGHELGLTVMMLGAAEIYIDGRLADRLGNISDDPGKFKNIVTSFYRPIRFVLPDSGPHILAIRFGHEGKSPENMGWGMMVGIADYETGITRFEQGIKGLAANQMFFVGLAIAFFLVAIFMYLFPPRDVSNLYFALVSLGFAAMAYFPPETDRIYEISTFIILVSGLKISIIVASVFSLLFVYSLFHEKLPRQFWVFLVAGVILLPGVVPLHRAFVYIYSLVVLAESVRVVIMAITRKKRSAWLIGVGFMLFVLLAVYEMLMDLGIFPPIIPGYYFYYLFGIAALLICEAMYLAKNFSDTHIDLQKQLSEVKRLSEVTVQQEVKAREQELEHKLLEQKIEFQKKELEEAKKLEKAMADLEAANREIRNTQSQLVQSEKMASMGMLVAGVAHEINTPVGAINSMHNTLVRAVKKIEDILNNMEDTSPELRDQLNKYLQIIAEANNVIESGSGRVTNIVRRLKSFARLDEAELKETDINEALEDTLTLAHHELKHDIEVVRKYGDLPKIPCFAGELNQVFLNIIINARQAIKGKGKITIRTAVEDNMVVVRISDTGHGIPDKIRAKIFDPGFTTKGVGVGTGLGLSICYQIIKSHHGRIEVESEPEKGTTFIIKLPMNLDKILDNG